MRPGLPPPNLRISLFPGIECFLRNSLISSVVGMVIGVGRREKEDRSVGMWMGSELGTGRFRGLFLQWSVAVCFHAEF